MSGGSPSFSIGTASPSSRRSTSTSSRPMQAASAGGVVAQGGLSPMKGGRGSRLLPAPREQEQHQLERVDRCLYFNSVGSSPSPESSSAHRDRQCCHQGLRRSSRRSQARALSDREKHLVDLPPVRHTACHSTPAWQAQPASRQALVEAGQHRSSDSPRPFKKADCRWGPHSIDLFANRLNRQTLGIARGG